MFSSFARTLAHRNAADRPTQCQRGTDGEPIDFETLRKRWDIAPIEIGGEPNVSEVMETMLQEDGPLRELMDNIRRSIGLPDNNKR